MGRKDEVVGKLAERQAGCVSRHQLEDFTHGAIHRRLEAGRWRRTLPGIYAIQGARESWEQELRSAMLWAGPAAAVSHLAAGAWYELDGVKDRPLEITVPHAQCPKHPKVVVHRSVFLGSVDVNRHREIRVTSMARTLVDLASLGDRLLLELALECSLRRRQVTLSWLAKYMERMERRRPGLPVLRKLVRDRAGVPVMDSPLEVKVFRLLWNSGLRPTRQLVVREGTQHLARVDLAFEREKLVLQCDSYEHHSSQLAWHRDRDVVSRLAALGWRTMMITHRDQEQRPEELLRRVREALSQ